MATDLFRREAIEHGRNRLVGEVITAAPPGSQIYTLVVCAIIAVLLAALVFGGFARRERVTGIVALDPAVTRIYAPSAGEVRIVHVHEGDFVKAGDPLVTLALATGRGAAGEGMSGQLSSLDQQTGALEQQQQLSVSLADRELQSLRQQKSSAAASLGSLERQRGLLTHQVTIASAEVERSRRLLQAGAGTERQVQDSQAALISRRSDVEQLNARIIEAQQSLRALDAQIGQRSVQRDETASQLAQRRAEVTQHKAEVLRQDQIVLTAPVSGRVAGVEAQPGQRAEAETPLAAVLPQGSRMVVNLFAPSRAVGFVRPGQEVRLLFDAFPYEKFGAGRGRVLAVAPVPLDPKQLSPDLKITEPVYKIRVEVIETSGRDPQRIRPLPGMTLSANLVLERRRLWEVFLEPVLAAVRQ